MKAVLLFILTVAVNVSPAAWVIQVRQQQSADSRDTVFRDELLDNLVGEWNLTRKIRGKSLPNSAKVEWVLNHQFLLLHMKDAGPTQEYEAMVFIGYDNAGKRYVAHWIDIFGGSFSETLGFGKRTGNSIKFVFEYPDGPFENTFTWNPDTKSWVSLMRSKEKTGGWKVFAEDDYRRSND